MKFQFIGRKKTVGLFLFLIPFFAQAQYFGQNKVVYDNLKFKIYNTPHFRIYYYEQESDAVKDVAQIAETWYDRLSRVFNHPLSHPNPIILYASPEHFQETEIIGGLIGEGIGGVTESGKNRVIVPLTGNWADNNHVIGHELVHAFQYDILESHDSLSLRAEYNYPLWFIEGMAEYLSLGSNDEQTAMYLRDALVNNDFPTLRKITSDYNYFPYRWGQAFWAFVAGTYGDQVIPALYTSVGIYGYEEGIRRTLGINEDSFNKMWKEQAEETYGSFLAEEKKIPEAGSQLFAEKKAIHNEDFAPSISPNGNYIAFLSTRDIFNIDLFLANAHTHEIVHRLATQKSSVEGNALRIVESAVTWSPDSRKLCYVSYDHGKHYLKIVNSSNGNVLNKYQIKNLESVFNPSWSPDGNKIAFAALHQGTSDLYVFDLKSKKTTRLTNDRFSDLQPSWSPDGKSIYFVTNRFSPVDLKNHIFGNLEVAQLNLVNDSIEKIPLFENADHINPFIGKDEKLYFISTPDGVSNLFRYDFQTKTIEQITHERTGVAGITPTSPAASMANKTGELVYSVFTRGGHEIYLMKQEKTKTNEIVADTSVTETESNLPPSDHTKNSEVSNYLNHPPALMRDSLFSSTDYKPKISLENVSNASIGVGNSPYGAAFGGALNLVFSDMLDQHVIYASILANGSIQDIGGVVQYVNQKHRYQWGFSFSHTPYGTVSYPDPYLEVDTVDNLPSYVAVYNQQIIREFDDQLSLIGAYPLSRVNRLEASVGYNLTSFSNRIYQTRYLSDQNGDVGAQIAYNVIKGDKIPSYQYGMASIAYVGDDAQFGLTDPLNGYRYRIEVGTLAGDFNLATLLIDARYYKRVKPVTFAMRALHYGYYFGDANRIAPNTIGIDYLVHGYNYYSLDASEQSIGNRLNGSKIGVFNFETRLPISGPRELAPIKSLALPATLNFFFDAGTAWSNNVPFGVYKPQPVYSSGLSLRINVLGAIVAEVYYAIPFDRPEHNSLSTGVFGFILAAGW